MARAEILHACATTNPTLIANAARPMREVIAEICGLVERPVSAEVAASKIDGMLADIAPNVVVKLPLTKEDLIAALPPAVFEALFKHPLTEQGLELFKADWARTGQSLL